ncbi:MAG TPA: hypothetical protein VJ110_03650 [Candidatus Nanoarchaeia archaeon]|nr:hypothetical protein [Candidatus Nanoarchaeia archaeon]
MGKRLNKFKERFQKKREEYVLEIKRQTVHALGILFVIPIVMFSPINAARILAVAAALTAFGHWYISHREIRLKYFKDFIKNLSLKKEERAQILSSAKEFKKFEESIILGAFKNFIRQKESPLFSSFLFLLSSLFALLLFGPEFAAIGLVCLGIGDAFSTLIGKRFGKIKLLHNKDKSMEGSLAFFFSAFAAVYLFLMLVPSFVLFNNLMITAALAAILGTAIETLPAMNDNATLPIGISVFLWLILLLL